MLVSLARTANGWSILQLGVLLNSAKSLQMAAFYFYNSHLLALLILLSLGSSL